MNAHTAFAKSDKPDLDDRHFLPNSGLSVQIYERDSLKNQKQALNIVYGFGPSDFGDFLIACRGDKICYLGFADDRTSQKHMERLRTRWPGCVLGRDDTAMRKSARAVLAFWQNPQGFKDRLKLALYGTAFQLQVWQALLRIPRGETTTYQEIARQIGRPKAARAVGNAVGANPVALLIPCHRVIRSEGSLGSYAWGRGRKKAILGLEVRSKK